MLKKKNQFGMAYSWSPTVIFWEVCPELSRWEVWERFVIGWGWDRKAHAGD